MIVISRTHLDEMLEMTLKYPIDEYRAREIKEYRAYTRTKEYFWNSEMSVLQVADEQQLIISTAILALQELHSEERELLHLIALLHSAWYNLNEAFALESGRGVF